MLDCRASSLLDLEDAVAPDAKPAARDAACAAVRSGEYGRRELTIRINAADTEWHEADMKAARAGDVVISMGCGDIASFPSEVLDARRSA